MLHIGNTTINLVQTCSSDHSLNLRIGNETWCAELTTEWADNAVHVRFNDVTYTVCDGACSGGSGGGEEYVMPETPPEPVEFSDDCEYTQTNENAYLYTEDGNQWFDTGVLLDSTNDISVTMQVANGKHARVFGALNNTACEYDMTLNQSGYIGVLMGKNATGSTYAVSDPTGKNTYSTKTASTGTNYVNKHIYVNDTKVSTYSKKITNCTSDTITMLVLNNDWITGANPALSGGIKLYNIKMYSNGDYTNPIHDFQPVKAGTNICGTLAATNAMWDAVTKKLYYPAGTTPMGYGEDPAE